MTPQVRQYLLEMTDSTLSRKQRAQARGQREDLSAAMAHPPTRRWMRALLDSCGVFAPSNADIFADGARSVGLGIIAEMNAIDPNIFPRLLQEGANEHIRAQHQAEKQE